MVQLVLLWKKGMGIVELFLTHHIPQALIFSEIRAGGTRRNPRAGMIDDDFLFHMQGKTVSPRIFFD